MTDEWRRFALCGDQPELMADPTREGEALAVCAACPVVVQCREWVLGELFIPGVVGATTEVERYGHRKTYQGAPQPQGAHTSGFRHISTVCAFCGRPMVVRRRPGWQTYFCSDTCREGRHREQRAAWWRQRREVAPSREWREEQRGGA